MQHRLIVRKKIMIERQAAAGEAAARTGEIPGAEALHLQGGGKSVRTDQSGEQPNCTSSGKDAGGSRSLTQNLIEL